MATVLHGGWLAGRLMIWGEVSEASHGRRTSVRGRRPGRAAPHPFDAGAQALVAALRGSGAQVAAPRGSRVSVAAWLPARGGRVFPSSSLVAEAPPARGAIRLLPHAVSVVPLSVPAALDFLCACVGRQRLAPGVLVGGDLAFWTVATRFAGALVARQHYLPGLHAGNGAGRARWEPVFLGADGERAAALAQHMPPVARALTPSGASTAPARPAPEVLREFIAEAVDALVRLAVGNAPVPAPGRRKARAGRLGFDSPHAQWLHALLARDGAMEGNAEALAALGGQVRAWQRPLLQLAAAPLRLCFRLEEPPAAEGDDGKSAPPAAAAGSRWYLRYLLQPVGDPSLLVPAADALAARGRGAAALRRHGVEPREYLLTALGQASALCPHVEASLREAAPGGYALDTAGAHEFLAQRAAALEGAGFGVIVPAWWSPTGGRTRLTARAVVSSPRGGGGGGVSLEQLVAFQWEVALGDQTLTRRELEALARLKTPLVKFRGQWVELGGEEIAAALALWKQRSAAAATLGEVVRMALGAGSAPAGLRFAGVRAAGWVGALLRRLEKRAGFEVLPAPAGFVGELRPYQFRGFSWLAFLRRWGLGACLADDMGLGKTIQTLALLQREREAGSRRPVLLVCPTSVVNNWVKEAQRFTPGLTVRVHHGAERAKGGGFSRAVGREALVITSYALLHRDAALLEQVRWGGVVLDEAQNIKNPHTRQARAARTLRAEWRLALTGTPVENNVGELWSLLEFLNPGWLGTQAEFKRRFTVPIQAGHDPAASERLRRLTGPFILRRLKTDREVIADLPEKLEMKVFCSLTREQASLYAAVLRDMEGVMRGVDGIRRKGIVLATLSKLKQVCNHPVQFLGDRSALPGRSGKLARLEEMLEEILATGDRALMFTQFAEMGRLLKQHLEHTLGREALFLHGAVSRVARDRMVERFQSQDGPALLVLSLKAGGTGLNLTRATHVFHFDRWWNPAVENQATDRAYRIGQTRTVQVHKFICAGTLEERIDEMIERKREVAGQVIGTGEAWLTELSNEALRDVFALRAEAVAE